MKEAATSRRGKAAKTRTFARENANGYLVAGKEVRRGGRAVRVRAASAKYVRYGRVKVGVCAAPEGRPPPKAAEFKVQSSRFKVDRARECFRSEPDNFVFITGGTGCAVEKGHKPEAEASLGQQKRRQAAALQRRAKRAGNFEL